MLSTALALSMFVFNIKAVLNIKVMLNIGSTCHNYLSKVRVKS